MEADPRPLKSQSQTGAGRLSHMGSQSGLATSGVLSPPAAPGCTASVVVERGIPEERQSASHLTQGAQGCGVEGSGLSNQLPPKPAPGQGWEFHKKSKRAL